MKHPIERNDVARKEKHKVTNGIYFITAIELGSPAYKPFLRAIETFLKEEDAELALLPMKSHRSPKEELPFDVKLVEKYIANIYTELELNRNIAIIELELNSQQINPLTGTSRLSKHMKSLVIGHSKQHLRVLPTGNATIPKIHCTTGALTIPNYKNNRIGRIATSDHITGGLILQVSNDRYHTFQVQCEKDGSFCFLNKRYHADGSVTKERVEALIIGDYHCGYTDKQAERATIEMCDFLQPKRILFHDFVDCASISHHNEMSISARLKVPTEINTLEKELNKARSVLEMWDRIKPKDCELIMVPSNHPEHLHRYLDEGRYVRDTINYRKAVELAFQYQVNGIDPIQYAIDPDKKLATWLDRQNDYRVEGCHVGNHGDKGIGGTRGSANSSEFAYDNCFVGHSHRPEICHKAYVVGTLSHLNLGYNYGAASWVNGNGVIYEGGQKSLLLIVNGKWKL